MIRIHVSAEDLMQTRFAFSPLWETVASYRAILDPARHALHLPWISRAREELEGWDLGPLEALVGAEGYIPDFLTPPPTTPFPEFLAEVERLRATPLERVREEVGRVGDGSNPALEAYLADPAGSLERLAGLLVRYHDHVLAPQWPQLHTLLEADVFKRARTLAFEGPESLFGGLHRSVGYRSGVIELFKPFEREVDPGGRGVLLIPVAFAWPDIYAIIDAPWQPTLVYSPRGVARLWESGRPGTDEALRAALGAGRASVLKGLVVPSTTTQLARSLAASPGTVSQHLARLRRAGLVEPHRRGRRVYYRLSSSGEHLLDLFGELDDGDAPLD
jgi:DNA-binding transcriptional ArsR family regulator